MENSTFTPGWYAMKDTESGITYYESGRLLETVQELQALQDSARRESYSITWVLVDALE